MSTTRQDNIENVVNLRGRVKVSKVDVDSTAVGEKPITAGLGKHMIFIIDSTTSFNAS